VGSHWFEDFEAGQRFVSQGVTFTEASIIEFATRYDPQRFHIDREAAARTHFGGLIASGFQTLGLAFRMFFQLGVLRDSGIGAPGIEWQYDLKLPAPDNSPIRRLLLGANVPIAHPLVNIDKLTADRVFYVGLPLRFVKSEASFIRAIALEEGPGKITIGRTDDDQP